MNITFHGAAQTVTGSKHLLSLKNGKKILLDCGLFQGMGKETLMLNESFGFESDDNLFIYEMEEKEENKKENNQPMEENWNRVGVHNHFSSILMTNKLIC